MTLDGITWLLRRLARINSLELRRAWRGFRLRRGGALPSGALPEDVCRDARCCFMLSTGRCGTMMLTKVLSRFDDLDVHHVPSPELSYPCRFAYWGQGGEQGARLAALCSRYELIRESHCSGGMYVETNNRVTFFAPALAELFPKALFVHLVRHPGAIVRQGLMRGYYAGGPLDEGRIFPRPDSPEAAAWDGWSLLEKNAWMWNATNAFIEDFKDALAPERVFTVKSEDLFTDPGVLNGIVALLGQAPFEAAEAERLLAKKINTQRGAVMPMFADWPEEDRRAVQELAPLAGKYGYSCQHGG